MGGQEGGERFDGITAGMTAGRRDRHTAQEWAGLIQSRRLVAVCSQFYPQPYTQQVLNKVLIKPGLWPILIPGSQATRDMVGEGCLLSGRSCPVADGHPGHGMRMRL